MEDTTAMRWMHNRATQIGGAGLRDQALTKLVRTLLSTTRFDANLLEAPKEIPNFGQVLRSHLYEIKGDLWEAPCAAALLRTAFAGETFLDWAPFSGLIPQIVQEALQGPQLRNARELSLCFN